MPAPKGNSFWRERTSHGRPSVFSSPEQMEAGCEAYFEWVESHPLYEAQTVHYAGKFQTVRLPRPRAMTLKGLCLHLGISRSTWDQYARIQGFTNISTRAREIIWACKLELAAANLLDANLIARDLGLKDKAEVDQKTTVAADNSVIALMAAIGGQTRSLVNK